MYRRVAALIVVSSFVAVATPAHAQWFSNYWSGFCRDYHRNVNWPEPFVRADRESVMLPFGIQTANGWRRQNLLSDYHFNQATQQLTEAGELKVRFILTQMPPSRRTLFVQRALTPEETVKRMEGVQLAAMRMLPNGGYPQVVESDLPNTGWPAEEIQSVTQRFRDTRPDPRMFQSSNAGGTPGSSGSSGSTSGR